jgi:hypothetical protein
MLKFIAAPGDAALAARIEQDLTSKGVGQGATPILVAVLSPQGIESAPVQQEIISALDNSSHIIPIITQPMMLPRMIDHLTALDFSQGYPMDALISQIALVQSGRAPLPLRVLTPKVRQSNRMAAYVLVALALMMFFVGVYIIGVQGVEFPEREYDQVSTEVKMTIDASVNNFAATNLPRSTSEAENFPATVQAAPTAQRPLLSATATALVEN